MVSVSGDDFLAVGVGKDASELLLRFMGLSDDHFWSVII